MANLKSVVILSFSLLFSYLFYNEETGLNVVCYIFPFLLILFFQKKEKFKELKVQLLSLGLIISSVGSWINGGVIVPFIFLFTLIGLLHGNEFVVHSFINSLINLLGGFVKLIESKRTKGNNFVQTLKYLVPFIIISVFFYLYRNVNPTFALLTEKFTFDKISFTWLFLTFFGFLIVIGVYNYLYLPLPENILKKSKEIELSNTKSKPKWNESFGFILTFGVINFMLIIILILDITSLTSISDFAEGSELKSFLHKGVGALVFSIFLGISILLFFFRNNLNFGVSSKKIKSLAIIWIFLNLFMILFTAFRNHLYINEALLSYKRIGVYFWLLFAIIGLIFTGKKIIKNKTSWYLVESFSNWFFVILALITVPSWDSIITDFNLKRAAEMEDISTIDKSYLLSLSETNIPSLYKFVGKKGFNKNPYYSYRSSHKESNQSWLDRRLFNYIQNNNRLGWQSNSLWRKKLNIKINELKNDHNFTSLDLQNNKFNITSLRVLKDFKYLRELNISSTGFNQYDDFISLDLLKLTDLNLSNNNIRHLDTLEIGEHLERLNLDVNSIESITLLNHFTNLDSLSITGNKISQFSNLAGEHPIRYLNLSGNPLKNLNNINLMSQLERLYLNNCTLYAGRLPELKNLKVLTMDGSIAIYDYAFDSETIYPSLEKFSCKNNTISNFDEINDKFPNLKTLDIGGNSIDSLLDFRLNKNIENISFKGNPLVDIDKISEYRNLKSLNFTNCDLYDLEPLSKLDRLENLSMRNNFNIRMFHHLNSLSNLVRLDLSFTGLSDLNEIRDLVNIEHLKLKGCRLINLKSLVYFSNVKTLDLSFVNMIDVKYLSKLINLEELNLSSTDPYVLKQIKKDLKDKKIQINIVN